MTGKRSLYYARTPVPDISLNAVHIFNESQLTLHHEVSYVMRHVKLCFNCMSYIASNERGRWTLMVSRWGFKRRRSSSLWRYHKQIENSLQRCQIQTRHHQNTSVGCQPSRKSVANPGLEVRSCRNAILLNPPNNQTTIIIIIIIIYYFSAVVSYSKIRSLFYISLVFGVWRRTTSQTGAFVTVGIVRARFSCL
jgi:hypothetical protein